MLINGLHETLVVPIALHEGNTVLSESANSSEQGTQHTREQSLADQRLKHKNFFFFPTHEARYKDEPAHSTYKPPLMNNKN